MEYFDFDIRIQAQDNGNYAVHAESQMHGEVDAVITLDPSAAEIKEIVRRLERRQTDRAFLESVGRDLYRCLFVDGIETIFQRSFGQVAGDAELGLRLRLRIGSPELAVLPWELLFSELDQEFIATRVASPLIRYLELPGHRRQLATPYPLRLLVAIPHGNDAATALDADAETRVIEQALEGLDNKVEVTYLHQLHADGKVSWQRILEVLAQQHYHCFHFIGHGAFKDDQGHLLLDGEHGADDVVADHRFAELFSNSPTIKLVVLNACKGASLSSSRPLMGSAAQLVKHGVPAVVAMQYNIYDEAAVKFARSFYQSLFQSGERGRVDVAVTRGRHRLSVDFHDELELAAPVLFMHTGNGLLFVPESGKFFEDLPKNKAQVDTLQAAQQATSSESEAARFKRRIAITKRSVQLGMIVAMLVFSLSWIRLLDIFTIDTQAEFLVMALGNNLAAHPLSEELRIVTVNQQATTSALRSKVGRVIDQLSRAGARTIALDIFYAAEDGKFKTDPPSGQALVESIAGASATVIAGARAAAEGNLQAPESLRQVLTGLGHLCYESKLGLARSLPVSVLGSKGYYPSLALAAFAAFRNGTIVEGENEHLNQVVVAFADRPSQQFQISEVNAALSSKACTLVADGAQVAHRFIRLTPAQQLAGISMTALELEQAAATNSLSLQEIYGGKLVLVGVLEAGDIINDLTGNRQGVYWQADAFNNLLLDEEIAPLKDSAQLLMMLLLAGFAVALRLHLASRKSTGMLIMLLATVAVLPLCVYTFGQYRILINPAYHILAMWFAWWLAGGSRKTWFR